MHIAATYGYVDLLRYLAAHPAVDVTQMTQKPGMVCITYTLVDQQFT